MTFPVKGFTKCEGRNHCLALRPRLALLLLFIVFPACDSGDLASPDGVKQVPDSLAMAAEMNGAGSAAGTHATTLTLTDGGDVYITLTDRDCANPNNIVRVTAPVTMLVSAMMCQEPFDTVWQVPGGPFAPGTDLVIELESFEPDNIVSGGYPVWTLTYEDGWDVDYNDFVLDVRTVSMECTPDPVVRGTTATCAIVPSSFSGDWTFNAILFDTTSFETEAASQPSWSGKAVQSGEVSVKVLINGDTITMKDNLVVARRPWTFETDGEFIFMAGDARSGCPEDAFGDTIFSGAYAIWRNQNDCEEEIYQPITSNGWSDVPVNDGGPNDGLWYAAGFDFSTETGTLVNPHILPNGLPRTVKGQNASRCKKNSPLWSGGDAVIVNFYDFNTVCEEFSLDLFFTSLALHEGFGTMGNGIEANGHEARMRYATTIGANDPYQVLDSIVHDVRLTMTAEVSFTQTRIGKNAYLLAASHLHVRDHYGTSPNCESVWLINPTLNPPDRYRFTPVGGQTCQ